MTGKVGKGVKKPRFIPRGGGGELKVASKGGVLKGNDLKKILKGAKSSLSFRGSSSLSRGGSSLSRGSSKGSSKGSFRGVEAFGGLIGVFSNQNTYQRIDII